jgi:phage terminase small subunit
MLSPPEGLEHAGIAAYRAAVETLEALGEDAAQSRTMLALYANITDAEEFLRREWVRLGRPVLAEGSSGQPVEHPLLGAMRDQARHLAAFAESLLLTPKARASARRAGWAKGNARSPDRQAQPGLRPAGSKKP